MSKINNYPELLAERARLELKITAQKAVITENINALKEELAPFLYLVPALSAFKKGIATKSVLKWVASIGIDLLASQKMFLGSNWITRLLVPRFLKQATSSALGANQQANP